MVVVAPKSEWRGKGSTGLAGWRGPPPSSPLRLGLIPRAVAPLPSAWGSLEEQEDAHIELGSVNALVAVQCLHGGLALALGGLLGGRGLRGLALGGRFLGGTNNPRRVVSDTTAQAIDREVRSLVDRAR